MHLINKVILLMVVVILAILFSNYLIANKNDRSISQIKALEIANAEAVKLNYNIENKNIIIKSYDINQNEYLDNYKNSKNYQERLNLLSDHKYWTIYYYPFSYDSIIKGGDLCIFIDAINGNVIMNLRGK